MRNKKQPVPEPSPEQVAVERHVEALMNPEQPDDPGAVNNNSSSTPIDIFQGIPTDPVDKVPLGPTKTAPELPGKAGKSLFSSVEVLNRSRNESVPVAIKSKPLAPVPSFVPAPASPKPATVPTITNVTVTSNSGVPSAAINIDKLARREEFADAATDSAVADIVAKEGDELLAVEDNVRAQKSGPVFKKPRRGAKFRKFFTSKWLLLLIPIILIALVVIPFTRYKIAGQFIKNNIAVTVVDSKTSKPVSGAVVSFNNLSTKTNSAGQAMLTVPVGNGKLSITKGYYKSYTLKETIGIGSRILPRTINLVATGRQVPITIINKLTHKPLAGVTVKVLGTSAISDTNGKLTIVLPAQSANVTATLSADGFNTATASIQVTDSVVPSNNLTLTPAGALYFLSNSSGNIDVVKTNLDGTGRQVVFAGTGKEDASNTSLVASRDWHYAVLKSRRDGSQTALYLIDTSTDKATQFDSSAATYTPIGWSGHNFVYDVVRTAQAQSQAGRESLKSYNADGQQLNQLDQSLALGTAASFAYQGFNNFFILDTLVVYNTQWYPGSTSGTAYDLSTQTDSIRTVGADGKSKKDAQTYAAKTTAYVQAAHVVPDTIDFGVYDTTTPQTTFYAYANNAVTTDASVTAATFAKTYPAYLAAPDGSKTFWNDLRGTKQALLLGDKNAASPATIASAGEYTAYGWFTNDYLLLSRAGSGLYIVPASGVGSNGAPLKVSDYFQSVTTPSAYGGGF